MAIIKNNVLGDMSGSLGKEVAYMRYGVQILASKPRKYEHKSPKVKAHRKKFSYVNSFAGIVYRNEVLGDVWREITAHKMAAYNEIIKLNSKYFRDNHPTADSIITPGGEENIVSEILYESGILNVKLLQDCPGRLAAIIVPFNPETGISEYYDVISEKVQSTEFEILLDKNLITKMNEYPNYIIFAALVNGEKGNLTWSKTFTYEKKQ